MKLLKLLLNLKEWVEKKGVYVAFKLLYALLIVHAGWIICLLIGSQWGFINEDIPPDVAAGYIVALTALIYIALFMFYIADKVSQRSIKVPED